MNGKNRTDGKKKRKAAAAFLAAFLGLAAGAFPGGENGNGRILAEASEEQSTEEDLLIEDEGDEVAVHEGADLDELRAAETQETQIQTGDSLLEDSRLLLEPAKAEFLQDYLEQLTQMESPIGSDGELIVGRYIKEVMSGLGYTISEQNFHEGFLNEEGVDAPGINIIAERGADAKERHGDILIISTHYDSRTLPEEGDPLANDKSGAAVLLEMARILSYEETDTDICFLFLSGEEDGLYGSVNFIRSLEEEHRNRVAGALYVEAVGYGSDYTYLLKTADGQANELGDLVREEALFSEGGIVSADGGEGGNKETETESRESGSGADKERQDWAYTEDTQTAQKSFADAGITAVTVCQDVEEVWLEAADEAKQEGTEVSKTDPEELKKITDILAAAAGQIMNESTGSFLN